MASETERATTELRKPRLEDGAAVHALIDRCKPLDLNSLYLYLLQCTHFRETCIVGEMGGGIVSFVSGYRKPEEPNVLFIWQVAVGEEARGQGLGKRMIRGLLERPACQGVDHIETTVTPSNEPSRGLFGSLAKALGTEISESEFFAPQHFGGATHEAEMLLRIGPFRFS